MPRVNDPGPCSETGCHRSIHARGWCLTHYRRWQRHGTIEMPSNEDRFWSFVDKRGPDECWPWLGKVRPNGYASFGIKKTYFMAHRYAFMLGGGQIPDGYTIDHLCHDPAECNLSMACPHRRCVNPAHLAPATARDNILRGGSPAAHNAKATHCKSGHAFDVANTYVTPEGKRSCRACDRIYVLTPRGRATAMAAQRRYREKKQLARVS